MPRDFTYVDDIVSGISKLLNKAQKKLKNIIITNLNPCNSSVFHQILNIRWKKKFILWILLKKLKKISKRN